MVAANSARSYRYGYGYYDTSGSLTALMVLTIIYLIIILLFHIFWDAFAAAAEKAKDHEN